MSNNDMATIVENEHTENDDEDMYEKPTVPQPLLSDKDKPMYLVGETIPLDNRTTDKRKVKVGQGMHVGKDGAIMAVVNGFLNTKVSSDGSSVMCWMDAGYKRYYPRVDDLVVGVVKGRLGEYLTVDICSKSLAELSIMAFDGVTNRNRPSLNRGDIVFARIFKAGGCLPIKLTCTQSRRISGKVLGALKLSGFVFDVGITFARHLLQEKCFILEEIAKEIKFETVVGVNGKIWIWAEKSHGTFAVYKIIKEAEKKCMNRDELRRRFLDFIM